MHTTGSCRISLPFRLLKGISKQVLDNGNQSRGLRFYILGCGYWRFGSRFPDLLSWVLILDCARKKREEEKKSVLNNTKTFNFKLVLFSQMPWPLYIMFWHSHKQYYTYSGFLRSNKQRHVFIASIGNSRDGIF